MIGMTAQKPVRYIFLMMYLEFNHWTLVEMLLHVVFDKGD